jgi:hypothetical protein
METSMRQPQGSWRACALAGALAALFASAGASAQSAGQAQGQAHDDNTVGKAVAAKQAGEIRRGDPARWYRDDASRQARLHTLQKEIGAAYQEAKNACRDSAASDRGACLKEARATYEQEMKNAPAQLDAAPEGAVQSAVQSTVQNTAQTTSSR